MTRMLDRLLHLSLPLLAASCALCALAPLNGCMEGSEIPNELSGTLVAPQGGPQADVPVFLNRSDRIPGVTQENPSAATRTDARGRYRFKNVSGGIYTMTAGKAGARAYRDSIFAQDGRMEVGTDTLKTPGALVGRVELDPADNPRIALVQVLGTDIHANVDSAGWFELTDMAEGRYRIRVFVHDSSYIPEFRSVSIRSGRRDTLPGSIEPLYIGLPRVGGLKAEALADGSIRLTWNRAQSGKAFTYAVFREMSSSQYHSANGIAYFLADTAYVDTVYSRNPRPDPTGFTRENNLDIYGGQFPYEETTAYRFRYRILTFLADNTEGVPSGYVHVTAIPPAASK